MVRALFALLLCAGLVQAGSIEHEVESILGKRSYASQKGLINVLFKKRSDFLQGDHLNMVKVLKTLKNNHLLDLDFKRRTDISLTFATVSKNPLLFVKIVKETLNSLGYNHTLTTKAMRDDSGFLWRVNIQSASMIDPYFIAKELDKRGTILKHIKRYSKDNWRFDLSTSRGHIRAKKLPFNKSVSLRKFLHPYWVDVEGARAVTLKSRNGNLWHPYIVFYDKDLEIVDNYTKERKSYNVSLKIPSGTKYMKIGDLYTLENIKRGLTLYIQK